MSVTFDYIIELYDILDTHTISWPIILLHFFLDNLCSWIAPANMYQLPSHPQACKLVFHPPSIPSGSNYPGTSVNVSHWHASHSSPYMRPLWPLPREVWCLCSHHHCTWWKTFVVLYIALYMQFQKYKAMHPRKPEGCLCGQSEAQLANLPSIPIATTQPLSTA